MLYHPFKLPDFVGAFFLLTLTFLLSAGLALPRMICVDFGMHLFWNEITSPESIEISLYVGCEILFAFITGLLAMSACRTLVPGAGRAQSLLLAAMACLIYGVITMLLQGRLPAFFFPTYLDYAADLPGWLLGYYLAGGQSMRQELGLKPPLAVVAGGVLVVTLAVLQPLFFPFYAPAAAPGVTQSFHSVPVPPPVDSGSMKEPMMPAGAPSFHPMSLLPTSSGGVQPQNTLAPPPYVPPSLVPPPITPDAQPTPIQLPPQP